MNPSNPFVDLPEGSITITLTSKKEKYQNGFWLLPSFDRPELLAKFFENYRKTQATTPGMVLVNDADHMKHGAQYAKIGLPSNWSYHQASANCMAKHVEKVLRRLKINQPEMEWIGLLNDDFVPVTEKWDTKLIDWVSGTNFVSSNDRLQAPGRITGAQVYSMPLVNTVGYLFPTGLKHLYQDNVYECLGNATGCWAVRMDVICLHEHVLTGGMQPDETFKKVTSSYAHDEAVFRDWLVNDGPAAVERIKKLQGAIVR